MAMEEVRNFCTEIHKILQEKIYVTTKLGRRIEEQLTKKGYKHIPMEEFVDRSLKNLGIERIDLVQLHCPPIEFYKKPETFELMDDIVKKGKVANYELVYTI